ncbi:NAD(P)/FAD-dependent oxidoreductase [Microbacterium murale]|uniref:Glycine/D-amino acid oxidase-like deaminating enzyme n=1 Tax=Microbacterium murale TaxID=1081040 RepID=A0ABU0P5L7_9MICO|nr:FAD-binding oxidoreductase [Microbacterium murale]MDQ0642252.1 glycine/D-amino acid oxidase-like deaminating enzyme [Microbacterium murale]
MSMRPVIVIGAGIIGASITYHLAVRGADVTLVDAGLPGAGATRHSFGWIGRSPGDSSPAGELRALGRSHWERLAREVRGLEVHWSGALVWGEHFAGRGPRDTHAATREPRLVEPPRHAEFRPDDGWVDPVRATESLISAAREHGASVRFGAPVTRLVTTRDGAVDGVELGQEILAASTVAVAAGVGSTALCATAGVNLPMLSSPVVMVRLRASSGLVRGIVANDQFEARQDVDGTVLIPLDYDKHTSTDELRRTGEEALRVFMASFTGADDATLVSAEIGWRPMMADEKPRVGYAEASGLYVAVAHPGITLASVIGHAAAEEILARTDRDEPAAHRSPGTA